MKESISKKIFLCSTIILLIIVFLILLFISIIIDPISQKQGKKFESEEYAILYFEQRKKDYNDIIKIMKEKEITRVNNYGSNSIGNGFFIEKELPSDKEIKILSELLKKNKIKSIIYISDLENDDYYQIRIINTINIKFDYLYTESKISEIYEEEKKYDKYTNYNIIKQIDDNYYYHYNSIPSI